MRLMVVEDDRVLRHALQDGLRDAGFAGAECVYREFQTVIVVGIRDQVRGPEGATH